LLDLAIGTYAGKETGEHALLRQLLHVFTTGDVALGDCYYPSFFLMATLMQMGVDAVFPMHSARDCDFRKGKKLGKKDHAVQWKKPVRPKWMDKATYDTFPSNIEVRELAVCTGTKGFRAQTKTLVTTFLDAKKYTKDDLSSLYDCRWFVEISLRSIKNTMSMDILRAKTPEMVRKEMWAHLLAYNLVRKIIAQSASQCGKIPRCLSFKCAMQLIFSFCQAGHLSATGQSYAYLLKAISCKAVGNRPGRSEPRVVKRRPKAFPKMQEPRSFYHQKAA
jgi:hypothetical protein